MEDSDDDRRSDIFPESGMREVWAHIETGDGFEGMGTWLPEMPDHASAIEAVTSEPAKEPVSEPTSASEAPTQPAGSIESALCAWPWDCWTAIRIARCESTLDPYAVGAGSYGLMQIQASVHAHKWPDFWLGGWQNPVRNLEYAWEIYHGYTDELGVFHPGRGWSAWSCY